MGWRSPAVCGGRALVAAAVALLAGGCTAYEYEEEVILAVDGSGSFRVSGSSAMLEALHADPATTASMRARFDGPGLHVDSVRETARDGRRFVHVQGTFEAWNDLCAHPAFAGRDCGLETTEDELALRLSLPAPDRDVPEDVPSDAVLALRIHFPSSVRYHNSRGGIERGNIIEWERAPSELFRASDLQVEARFERRSVLATTLLVLGTALAIVVGAVALALWWMVRRGRRELALESQPEQTSPVRGPSL